MRRSLMIPGSFGAVVVVMALAIPAPALSQTATRGDTSTQPAGRTSKVEAITVKQSTAAAYLKIGDIKGESTHDKHKGEIDVLSYSWGTSATPTRSRPPQGPGTLTITKAVDASSTALTDASRSRRRFQQLTLTLPSSRQGEAEITLKLADVVVASVRRSSDGSVPTESISFNYTKVE
jgi:type VI secretion system secreted protein Hcp